MVAAFETGFVVGKAAWHGLATVLESAPQSSAEAIRLAGLDWEVVTRPVFAGENENDIVGGIQVKNARAVMRARDKRVYAVVGDQFTPLQNKDAFEFFDPFLRDGKAELHTAGGLWDGEYIWVLAKLPGGEGEVGKGDLIQSNLLLYNSHSGGKAVGIQYTPIRVVCWNTLSAAINEGERTRSVVKIRHHARVKETLKEVQGVIDLAHRTFSLSMEQYREMRKRRLDTIGLRHYVKAVFHWWDDEEEKAAVMGELLKSKAAKAAVAEEKAKGKAALAAAVANTDGEEEEIMPKAMEMIEAAFESGPGSDMAGKTLWGAYNAVTYHIDHERSRTQDNRLGSSWFGMGRKIRDRAHDYAMQMIS